MRAIEAVVFDIGGVVQESPLDAIARYERDHGLPPNTINRAVVAAGEASAWARLERGELTVESFLAPFEADCRVHYSIDGGYFLTGQNGHRNDLEVIPAVRCLDDGTPMYLAEIDLDKREYRLWICPQCGGRRTHEQGLVSMPSRENHDAGGEKRSRNANPR